MKTDAFRTVPAEPPEAEGWTRQFVADEPRLSEAAALYREAGFEVRLEPLPRGPACGSCAGPEEKEQECRVCFAGVEDRYRIIYTRKTASAPPAGLDLS